MPNWLRVEILLLSSQGWCATALEQWIREHRSRAVALTITQQGHPAATWPLSLIGVRSQCQRAPGKLYRWARLAGMCCALRKRGRGKREQGRGKRRDCEKRIGQTNPRSAQTEGRDGEKSKRPKSRRRGLRGQGSEGLRKFEMRNPECGMGIKRRNHGSAGSPQTDHGPRITVRPAHRRRKSSVAEQTHFGPAPRPTKGKCRAEVLGLATRTRSVPDHRALGAMMCDSKGLRTWRR